VKTTAYFDAIRTRFDRSQIKGEWIERAITSPLRELRQAGARLRRRVQAPELSETFSPLRGKTLYSDEDLWILNFERGEALFVLVSPDGQTMSLSPNAYDSIG
jgi:hypothetical protein